MSRIRELWSNLSPNARRGVVGGGIGLVALILVGAAVASSGGGGKEEAAPKKSTTTASTTSTTKPVVTTTTEPYKGPTAPLTGLRVADDGILYRPAVAVKVDNLDAPRESAVPQTGLPSADIVFEEIVEGNITRFVALFHSHMPGRVGPVRSARTSDTDILPMFGKTLLAWSGANAGVSARVRSTPGILDVGYDVASGSYERDHSRPAPHNLYVHADQLWGRAVKGMRFPNTMFSYREPGQGNPKDAPKSQGVDIDWKSSVAAPVSWRWDPKNRVYVRYQRGRIL